MCSTLMAFVTHIHLVSSNLLSSNKFPIIVNGKSCGFFSSTRGVKQGDHISPFLFILATETLGRGISYLQERIIVNAYGQP